MRLAGKVAIVTGGGSGFGEGIAKRFAEEGAKLVVNDFDDAGGRRVTAEIEKAHGQGSAIYVRGDVAKNDEVKELVDACIARFSHLDIMVNNAGISHRNMPMLEVPEAMVDKILAVNVKSIYLAALHVVPLFRRQGKGGVIINTASKGAAIVMTKSMAVEYAPDNIRVNALCPVAGETPLLGTFMGADTPENRAKFKASIPLGRLSTPRA